MNSLRSCVLAGATALTLATATETEATSHSTALSNADRVTSVLATTHNPSDTTDTANSSEKSWGEVLGSTALFGLFCFAMYKVAFEKGR